MTSHGGEISVTEANPKIAEFVINHEIWEHCFLPAPVAARRVRRGVEERGVHEASLRLGPVRADVRPAWQFQAVSSQINLINFGHLSKVILRAQRE